MSSGYPPHDRLDSERKEFVDLFCRLFDVTVDVFMKASIYGALEYNRISTFDKFICVTKEQIRGLECPSTPMTPHWKTQFHEENLLNASTEVPRFGGRYPEVNSL